MRRCQLPGSLQPESDADLPKLPVMIGPCSMPVYPTTEGVFDRAYGCAGDDAQPFERARIESALALKQDELAKEEKRRQRHEVLEEASMDLFEGTPPALLNAFLYSREHELGSALFNAAAAFPFLGSLMMRGKRGFQLGSSATKRIAYHPRIGAGSTSIVREDGPGKVLKEIIPIYRQTGVLVDLKPGEREKLTELLVVATTGLRSAMDQIPETRLAGPGFIRQTKVEGLHLLDLHWTKWLSAFLNMHRAGKKAKAWAKAHPLDLPKGWEMRIDTGMGNFRFDKNGNINGWVDPFWIGDESWWDHVHPFLWTQKFRF